MSYDVSLILNYNRVEKINAAWKSAHTGAGLSFVQYAPGANPAYYDNWEPGPLPDYFWREPHTGTIMRKPLCMIVDRLKTGAELIDIWFKFSDFDSAGTTGGANMFEYSGATALSRADYRGMQFHLATVADDFQSLSVDSRLAALIPIGCPMVWNLQTSDPLAINQGFTAIVIPGGMYGDSVGDHLWWGFGGKFAIQNTEGGIARFMGWNGANWIQLYEFAIGGAGVNALRPYQMTVIPFARRFITVLFSQAGSAGVLGKSSSNVTPNFNDQSQGFLVVLRGGAFEPTWNSDLQQWQKTDAAPITVGFRAQGQRYDFILGKVNYGTDLQAFYCSKEVLPARPTWDTVTAVSKKQSGQLQAGDVVPAALGITIRDGHDVLYNPATGAQSKVAVAKVTMQASGSGTTGLYTPELYTLSLGYKRNSQITAFSQYDASAFWQLIRGQKTTACEASRIEIKYIDDARYQQLFLMDGPVRVTAKDNSGVTVVIADGFLRRKEPGIEGPNQLTTNQAEGLDMWHRLDGSPLKLDPVEGDEVADTIAKAIKTVFQDSEVTVDYAGSPELLGLTFSGFSNPNDILRPNEDSTIGDFIRACRDAFAVQLRPPLRVRWLTGNKWQINLGPVYTRGAAPDCSFVFDDTLIGCAPTPTTFATEQARYVARWYKAFGTFEPLTQAPPFNSLLARNAKDVGGQQGADTAFIAPDPRVISDPTYIGYEGCENVKLLGVQELPMANSQGSLQQQVRAYFDIHYNLKELRTVEFSGEWQPETDADQFCVIIGRAKADDPGHTYVKGDPVSYGIWRIDDIDFELRHDGALDSASASRRWEWTGSYRNVFVDKDTYTGLPMWTPDANLPLT